jgi:hypothetical protein
VELACPRQQQGRAVWWCGGSGQWQPPDGPDLSNCTGLAALADLLARAEVSLQKMKGLAFFPFLL